MNWELDRKPGWEIVLMVSLGLVLVFDLVLPGQPSVLGTVAFIGALPTAYAAAKSLRRGRVSIEVFNCFALIVSFWTGELRSAVFIDLMLASARILEWHTESRTKDAVEELLRLKPTEAVREVAGGEESVPSDGVKAGDVLIVRNGARVAVDGLVTFGEALVNEASVTGESVPTRRGVGDVLLAGTLVESGAVKIRATRVGKDSTIERMAELMRQASEHKSRSERLADKFAGYALPAIAVFGAAVYLITKDAKMMASIFLVSCADDIAVAVPLAVSAGLGLAAKRGVIVKGGEWLDALSRIGTVVLDKTGTLTFGDFRVRSAALASRVDERSFWNLVGAAEKYSEHPVGRAITAEARSRGADVKDPESVEPVKGAGIIAVVGGKTVLVGSLKLLTDRKIKMTDQALAVFRAAEEVAGQSAVSVAVDGRFWGTISVADVPRPEAGESLKRLAAAGVGRVVMFTGDNPHIAAEVAARLGIKEFRAGMTPEDKLVELERLAKDGPVVMVGDGVNDAPALARADVGIAMGLAGAAVAVEAADVVVTTDDLSRLPEMIELGKRVRSVVKTDIAIWIVTNLVGFALVLTGAIGPAFAAFYNFATDFLPLGNSARLFRDKRK